MMLSEIEFVFFLPLVLLLHWLLPRRAVWQNAFLLLVSYFFYATWNYRLLPLIVAATVVDYAVGLYLGNRPLPASGEPPLGLLRKRRLALGVSLAWNVGVLCFFKYYGFFVESLNSVLAQAGLAPSLPVLGILLPLGISYYTLQKLAYVIEVFYERHPPCRDLLRFALYTAFFPQLIAGPISTPDELLPQLKKARRLDPDTLRAGGWAFFFGFFQKAYVAAYLGRHVVDPVFTDPAQFSSLGHWIALFGYAGQVFCDFAGYSLMAIGCGRLLGVELPQNFNLPFLAKSMFEFWRRWHITLNRWLFDYIYGSIATSRGWWRGRLDLGLMLVFLASGIWHGAAWTFLIWGVLHGLALVVNRRWDVFYRGLCRKDRSYVKLRRSRKYLLPAWALTQAFFILSLIPFRSPSFEAMAEFATRLFVSAGTALPGLWDFNRVFSFGVSFAFIIGWHLTGLRWGQWVPSRFFGLPAPARGALYGLLVIYLTLLMPVGGGAFIYGQF